MADAAASLPPAPAAPIVETPTAGLTSAQVAERRARGLANAGGERTSRSVAEILRANVLTRFNFILGVLLAVILAEGQPQDALFGVVLVTNALIGIVQELRAKRTLDRLAVLSAPRVRVIRDGAAHEIAVADLVAGDLVDLRAGDQLVADGVVRASASLEADESLLTGESEPVGKRAGDRLLSGSFVVAGSGGYQATGVGADAYARKLAAQARRFALVRSELMDGINQILRYVTWAIGPVAVLLVISGWHAHGNVRQVASGTVAALVGMVPQGLVLLTSVAFGVAGVTLARRRVLVQQLPAVEGLARVDVVCLDKTGTLTDGTIAFDSLIRLDGQAPAEAALGALADDENATRRWPPSGRRSRRRRGGRGRRPCRSPRRASGARPASPARAPGCWEHRRWCCPQASRTSCRRPPPWPPAAAGSWYWHMPRARWTASRSRRACGRRPSSCSPSGSDPTPPRPSRTSPRRAWR
jgi:cation-transporting ATPase E